MVARSTSGVIPIRGSDPYAQRDRRSSSVSSLSVWHSGVCARMSHAGLSEHEPSEQYESSHRSVPMTVHELRRQVHKAAARIDESLADEVEDLIFEHDVLNAQRLAVLSSGQGLVALVKESFTLYRELQHARKVGRRILCNPQEEPETIKRDVPKLVVPALQVLTDVNNVVSYVVSSFDVHWQLARMLGSGGQGAVWEARNRVDSTRSVAVKLAKAGDAAREIAAYRHLQLFERHPNVLEFHFAFRDQWHVNLGFELCKTDLCDLVVSKDGLAEAEARVWVRQLVAAVTYLHACDVVHLDIKLDNMFITHAGYLKLGDLGSAIVCSSSWCTSSLWGTNYYAAPEMLMTFELGRYEGRAADVWSIGVSACVMVRCVFPFHSDHPAELYNLYIQGLRTGSRTTQPPLVLGSRNEREPYSPLLLQLLDKCLAIDPTVRPSASALSEMPWLACKVPLQVAFWCESLARHNRPVKRHASHDTSHETGEHNRRVMARS